MMLETCDSSLPKYLLDIADRIQIESDFCVSHSDYQSFILPPTVAKRFKQASLAVQNKYLTLLLRNLLYGIYYNGSLINVLALSKNQDKFLLHKSLEFNCDFGVDWEFYEQLDQSNYGTGYLDCAWQVLKREPDGSLALSKDGLTLHIEYDHDSEPPTEDANIGELISISMPNNQMQNEFYIAIGDLGREKADITGSEVGQFYFNVSPSGAIALMDNLTLELNKLEISFSFQVLHNPKNYKRFDSGILNFERKDYFAIRKVLQVVYPKYKSYFESKVPLFTKFLAPGLSLAEEPTQKFALQESFGTNRCQIIANALLDAWRQGENSPDARVNFIHQHFEEMGISLQRPYLNPNSEDIYQALNL